MEHSRGPGPRGRGSYGGGGGGYGGGGGGYRPFNRNRSYVTYLSMIINQLSTSTGDMGLLYVQIIVSQLRTCLAVSVGRCVYCTVVVHLSVDMSHSGLLCVRLCV